MTTGFSWRGTSYVGPPFLLPNSEEKTQPVALLKKSILPLSIFLRRQGLGVKKQKGGAGRGTTGVKFLFPSPRQSPVFVFFFYLRLQKKESPQ